MWRKLRITILAMILLVVAADTYLRQLEARDWDHPLDVVVYPVDRGQDAEVSTYIASLKAQNFTPISQFLRNQAKSYGVSIDEPVRIRLGPVVHATPPRRPQGNQVLSSIWYSLALRWWAMRHDAPRDPGQIRLFVAYYNPDVNDTVPDSLALPKGLVGLIHAYASVDYAGTNNFVITHELLHTLGATDKYDPVDNSPLFPTGFANPFVAHRYPQVKAEIMGGRIPLEKGVAFIPDSLQQAVIGSDTAVEINWFK